MAVLVWLSSEGAESIFSPMTVSKFTQCWGYEISLDGLSLDPSNRLGKIHVVTSFLGKFPYEVKFHQTDE